MRICEIFDCLSKYIYMNTIIEIRDYNTKEYISVYNNFYDYVLIGLNYRNTIVKECNLINNVLTVFI